MLNINTPKSKGGNGVKAYFDIRSGKLRQSTTKVDLFTPGELAGDVIDYPVIKVDRSSKGKTPVYYKDYPGIIGKIEDIYVEQAKSRFGPGQDLTVKMIVNAGDRVQVQFAVSGQNGHTSYFKNFASKVGGLELSKDIEISPYDFTGQPTPEYPNPKRQIGVNLFIHDPSLPPNEDGERKVKVQYQYEWNAFGEPEVNSMQEKSWAKIEDARFKRFLEDLARINPGKQPFRNGDAPSGTQSTQGHPLMGKPASYLNPDMTPSAVQTTLYWDGIKLMDSSSGAWVEKAIAPPTPPPPPVIPIAPPPAPAQVSERDQLRGQPEKMLNAEGTRYWNGQDILVVQNGAWVSEPIKAVSPPPPPIPTPPVAAMPISPSAQTPQFNPQAPSPPQSQYGQPGVSSSHPTDPNKYWDGYQELDSTTGQFIPVATSVATPPPPASPQMPPPPTGAPSNAPVNRQAPPIPVAATPAMGQPMPPPSGLTQWAPSDDDVPF